MNQGHAVMAGTCMSDGDEEMLACGHLHIDADHWAVRDPQARYRSTCIYRL